MLTLVNLAIKKAFNGIFLFLIHDKYKHTNKYTGTTNRKINKKTNRS